MPTSVETFRYGVACQNFQGGVITWTAASGARVLSGSIAAKFGEALVGVAKYGPALTDATALPASYNPNNVTGAQVQQFVRGAIVVSDKTSAFFVPSGTFSQSWNSNQSLGLPISDVFTNTAGQNELDFQLGNITIGADGNAVVTFNSADTSGGTIVTPGPTNTDTPTPPKLRARPAPPRQRRPRLQVL